MRLRCHVGQKRSGEGAEAFCAGNGHGATSAATYDTSTSAANTCMVAAGHSGDVGTSNRLHDVTNSLAQVHLSSACYLGTFVEAAAGAAATTMAHSTAADAVGHTPLEHSGHRRLVAHVTDTHCDTLHTSCQQASGGSRVLAACRAYAGALRAHQDWREAAVAIDRHNACVRALAALQALQKSQDQRKELRDLNALPSAIAEVRRSPISFHPGPIESFAICSCWPVLDSVKAQHVVHLLCHV